MLIPLLKKSKRIKLYLRKLEKYICDCTSGNGLGKKDLRKVDCGSGIRIIMFISYFIISSVSP